MKNVRGIIVGLLFLAAAILWGTKIPAPETYGNKAENGQAEVSDSNHKTDRIAPTGASTRLTDVAAQGVPKPEPDPSVVEPIKTIDHQKKFEDLTTAEIETKMKENEETLDGILKVAHSWARNFERRKDKVDKFGLPAFEPAYLSAVEHSQKHGLVRVKDKAALVDYAKHFAVYWRAKGTYTQTDEKPDWTQIFFQIMDHHRQFSSGYASLPPAPSPVTVSDPVCGEVVEAICERCGTSSTACAWSKNAGKYENVAKDFCTPEFLSLFRDFPAEVSKAAFCWGFEKASAPNKSSQDDCYEAFKIGCELCGTQSDMCKLSYEWLKIVQPGSEECRMSLVGMIAGKWQNELSIEATQQTCRETGQHLRNIMVQLRNEMTP